MTTPDNTEDDLPKVTPSERRPWMTDQDWTEFIEWDRTIANHYGVIIKPDYEPPAP